jgi:hypothetical protein
LELLGKELSMWIDRKVVGGPESRVGLLQTGDLRSALRRPSTARFVVSSPTIISWPCRAQAALF